MHLKKQKTYIQKTIKKMMKEIEDDTDREIYHVPGMEESI